MDEQMLAFASFLSCLYGGQQTIQGDRLPMKIISGGQTGADRAALDAAISLGLPYGGWLPRGRKAEDGPLPARYRLLELSSGLYRERTQKNILDSDGTLIVSFGPLTGGSALTEALAIRHDRPCIHIDLEQVTPRQAKKNIEQWLARFEIRTLNVAGPRASGEPRIYEAVYRLLRSVDWPQNVNPTGTLHASAKNRPQT